MITCMPPEPNCLTSFSMGKKKSIVKTGPVSFSPRSYPFKPIDFFLTLPYCALWACLANAFHVLHLYYFYIFYTPPLCTFSAKTDYIRDFFWS